MLSASSPLSASEDALFWANLKNDSCLALKIFNLLVSLLYRRFYETQHLDSHLGFKASKDARVWAPEL